MPASRPRAYGLAPSQDNRSSARARCILRPRSHTPGTPLGAGHSPPLALTWDAYGFERTELNARPWLAVVGVAKASTFSQTYLSTGLTDVLPYRLPALASVFATPGIHESSTIALESHSIGLLVSRGVLRGRVVPRISPAHCRVYSARPIQVAGR